MVILELQSKVCEDFTITEKDPTRSFSWLKVPTCTFTFKTLLNADAKVIRDEWVDIDSYSRPSMIIFNVKALVGTFNQERP